MTQYLYDGVLTDQNAEYIRGLIQKYPYVVEVTSTEGFTDVLKPQDWWQESDMDNKMYPRKSTLYAVLSIDDDHGFFFVNNQDDYSAVVNAAIVNNVLLNKQPFRSVI